MHMRKILCLGIMLTLLSFASWAQRTVSGKVSDDRGNPLPNVSVQVKNTAVGTVSNQDGTFSLNVPANGRTLVFSFTDMGTEEVEIGNRTEVNATLKASERT